MQEGVDIPLEVSLLALPETTPTTLHAFLEVFSGVGVAWQQLTGQETAARRIVARIVGMTTEPYRSPVGPLIAPDVTLSDSGQPDVAIVTDLALPDGVPESAAWAEEAAWMRRRYEAGATVASVCTGSLFLAEAGLLDGLQATTHWSAVDLFRSRYPNVQVMAQRILCPAGEGHRVITAGGAGSWEELALYLIARYCGVEEAHRIARIFVLGDRSQGQSVYSAMRPARRHDDAIVAEAEQWLADNYAVRHPVRRIVRRSAVPERTFKRRFKAATGYSAVEYVHLLRIEESRRMLETTREPVDDIALAVGYEDAAYFRRLFKRKTGVTPAQYRRRYQRASYLPNRP